MSKRRIDLQKRLVGCLAKARPDIEDPDRHVYFQPPVNIHMKYPAIVYERSSGDTQFADNAPYVYEKRYSVTVIDSDADSPIPDEVAMLPKCVADRHFVSENLHHDSFVLYY